ncbi:MAG: hypothetical protein ACXABY_35985 [Candidatus Thorarchaeota archaeon]|jgi:hypothetical protein
MTRDEVIKALQEGDDLEVCFRIGEDEYVFDIDIYETHHPILNKWVLVFDSNDYKQNNRDGQESCDTKGVDAGERISPSIEGS